jgi:hypothetical protein
MSEESLVGLREIYWSQAETSKPVLSSPERYSCFLEGFQHLESGIELRAWGSEYVLEEKQIIDTEYT